MIRQLRRKFVAIIMAASTLILLAVFTVLVLSTGTGIRNQSARQLEMALGSGPKEGFRERGGQRPADLPEELAPPDEGEKRLGRFLTFTALVTEDGEVELGERADMLLEDYDAAELESLCLQVARSDGERGALSQYRLRYLKRETDEGTLIAFTDTSLEDSSLTELIKNSLIVGLLTLLVVFCASVLLARWAVKPVETAWNQQRQFVGDASHELKTPLTVILSNADMILSHPGEDSARWAENIRAEGQRMKELTQQLLSLARSEDSAAQPVFETVDLSYLVTDCALSFEPAAFENGHELDYEKIAPGISLSGDKAGLTQLCGILLENAVKYAAPGGKISVSLEAAGKNARLTVSDEGEPIPADQLGKIFERFYRADESRHSEGHGLGLAIARRVAQLHRGKIWAESENGINSFIVTLPLGKRPA